MPLLAYNKTNALLPLAAGNPIVSLPAASSAGARGKAFNVTGELLPNLTVDPVNGVAGGLSAASFALLQAQVAANQVEYEWSEDPEYLVATLVIGSPPVDIAEEDAFVYVDATLGNDNNPGTLAQPVLTFNRGLQLLPEVYKKACRLILAPGAYTVPDGAVQMPRAEGPFASTFLVMGPGDGGRTVLANGTEAAGGSPRVFTDAAAPFGAVDSLVGYWVRVTSGAQINQRRQIKSNTASVVTTNTDMPGNIANLDTFTIEKPSAIVTFAKWRPINTQMGFKDIELSIINGPSVALSNFFLTGAYLFMQGVQITLGGANAIFFPNFGSSGMLQNGNTASTWDIEGASNPFNALQDSTGMRISGTGIVAMRGGGSNLAIMTIVGGATLVLEGRTVLNHNNNCVLTMIAGSITVRNASTTLMGGSSANPLRIDAAIVVENASAILSNVVQQNLGASTGVKATRNAYVRCVNVTGSTGNTGLGLNADSNGVIEVDSPTVVSGTAGDIKSGQKAVRTYADFRLATPAGSGITNNEYDLPSMFRQPLKFAFTGLVAADTFNITLLAGSPPAIQNASTLRVVAGAAAFLGTYMLVDSGGTPLSALANTVVGVATLSDDGKTIGFPAGTLATAFTIEYTPVAGVPTGARIWQP